jgi:hypothetical protein
VQEGVTIAVVLDLVVVGGKHDGSRRYRVGNLIQKIFKRVTKRSV